MESRTGRMSPGGAATRVFAVCATALLAVTVLQTSVAAAAPITPSDPLGLGDDPVESVLDTFGLGNKVDQDPNNYAYDCPDILIVAITGATDSESDRNPVDEVDRLPWSNWVGNVTVPTGEANAEYPGRVGWVYVPYASEYGVAVADPVPTYQESVREGLSTMTRMIDENKTACGTSTKYVLLGYSVGAEAVERLAVDIGSRPSTAHVSSDDIAGVALVGDPYRPAGTASLDKPGPPGGGFMSSEPKDYGTLTDKIRWACRPMDIACDAPENLGVLPLALNVFGRMHFTLLDPARTVTDFAAVSSDVAARTIAHVFSDPGFATSDESVLDVMLRVSDRTEPTADEPAPSPQEMFDAAQWAMGPGRSVVEAKLAAEAKGFAADNADIPQLWEKPYIELGFLQHLYYWDNFPDNGRDWESEKLIRWITDIAREKSEKPPVIEPAVPPAADGAEAPRVIPPVAPGYLAPPAAPTETVPSTWEEVLKSLGLPPEPGK
ncbi:cutinase family protein [Rhodococcus sp. MEB064]|uniref:cutinase family protein n=1 Tax=Rhodococcus sp. MEB064 TaxID=1587522 RepID=UPI001E492A44|nr:cutinase family protein [Rhodococcus sp. MEB064]